MRSYCTKAANKFRFYVLSQIPYPYAADCTTNFMFIEDIEPLNSRMSCTQIAHTESTNTRFEVLGARLVSLANAVTVVPLDRRRSQRIRLQIPIFVRRLDHREVELLELAKTLDISNLGAKLIGRLPLRCEDIISLTIPAPIPTSPELGGSGTPPIQARVLRLDVGGEMEVAAVEFLRPLD